MDLAADNHAEAGDNVSPDEARAHDIAAHQPQVLAHAAAVNLKRRRYDHDPSPSLLEDIDIAALVRKGRQRPSPRASAAACSRLTPGASGSAWRCASRHWPPSRRNTRVTRSGH